MSVVKVIEVLSNSSKSWEDATQKGILKAGESIQGIKSAFVQSHSVTVNKNKIKEYRVNLKISFVVK